MKRLYMLMMVMVVVACGGSDSSPTAPVVINPLVGAWQITDATLYGETATGNNVDGVITFTDEGGYSVGMTCSISYGEYTVADAGSYQQIGPVIKFTWDGGVDFSGAYQIEGKTLAVKYADYDIVAIK